MKKTLLFALLALILPIVADAFDFESGGIYYNINNNKTSVSVTYFSNSYSGSVVIPPIVTYDSNTYSVSKIGRNAFRNCSSLTSVTIPSSVTVIGIDAFAGCTGLTSVTIPNSVTSIEDGAFNGCVGLTDAIIPHTVTNIGNRAFLGCSGLKEVPFSKGLKNIDGEAFYGCSSLKSIIIPSSVENIGDRAFSNCPNLESIFVDKDNKYFDSRNFCSAIIKKGFDTPDVLIVGCKNTVIPISAWFIGDYAFEGCSGLTTIIFPDSVCYIGDYAFSGCTGLTRVFFPLGTSHIGSYAFNNCTNLSFIDIPSRIVSICDYAFSECPRLKFVSCAATKVPDTANEAFYESNPESATLFVPENVVNDYKSTFPWSLFGTILPIEESSYILGDANGNGEVEIGDVTSVLTLMATPEAPGYDTKAADANKNGVIEIGDVTTILTIMAGAEWYMTVRDQSDNYVVSAQGQTNTITLTTTKSVDLSCNENWVHLGTIKYSVLENGKRYELYPEVTFDENTSGEERAAIIYFDNGGPEKMSLVYTQLANEGESCSDYDVVPPSWKGFDYKVKKGGTGEEMQRGEIGPGDKVRVYCYRKSNGVLTGMVKGTITFKWTTQADGPSITEEFTESVITPVNSTYDGWLEYSYADFDIPDGGPYDFCKAAVTCNLYFECFGQNVKWEDNTSHVDPYIGSIYTTNCIATYGSAGTTEDVLLWKSN